MAQPKKSKNNLENIAEKEISSKLPKKTTKKTLEKDATKDDTKVKAKSAKKESKSKESKISKEKTAILKTKAKIVKEKSDEKSSDKKLPKTTKSVIKKDSELVSSEKKDQKKITPKKPTQAETTTKANRKPLGLLVSGITLLTIVLIISGLSAYYFYYTSPEQSISRFNSALKDKDYAKAEDYIDFQEFNKDVLLAAGFYENISKEDISKSEEELKAFVKEKIKNGEFVIEKPTEIDRNGETLKVDISIVGTGESKVKKTAVFEKIKRNWVLIAIQDFKDVGFSSLGLQGSALEGPLGSQITEGQKPETLTEQEQKSFDNFAKNLKKLADEKKYEETIRLFEFRIISRDLLEELNKPGAYTNEVVEQDFKDDIKKKVESGKFLSGNLTLIDVDPNKSKKDYLDVSVEFKNKDGSQGVYAFVRQIPNTEEWRIVGYFSPEISVKYFSNQTN